MPRKISRKLTFETSRLKKREWETLSKLNTPEKIQDFLNKLPFNLKEKELPVAESLEIRKAHCLDGALIAAAALWIQGETPLLLDIQADKSDKDHVVALFRKGRKWGAISKTNHAVLRYREPVYRDVRELAMSYFHEYFLSDGTKTMRSFSKPFDLRKLGTKWLIDVSAVVDLAYKLDNSPHTLVLDKESAKLLRRADKIEREMSRYEEWTPRGKRA
jgi:hypothetical protein